MARSWLASALLLGAGLAAGCVAQRPAEPANEDDRLSWPDPLEWAPRGEDQREIVCARDGEDPVRDVFCGDRAPAFDSLAALQQPFFVDAPNIGGYTGVSLTANSTALSARSVSAINPRLIAVRVETDMIEVLALAFTRGEQGVEFVVRDRVDGELRFYLLRYRQACNEADEGCGTADLLTPATESGWVETSLYDEEDLANTALDCRQCHQPDGPGTPKLMRMQERLVPWTHWFWKSTNGGRELIADYFDAHGDEVYGGMTAELIDGSHPGSLATIIELSGNGQEQPNEFASGVIEAEVLLSARDEGGDQPADNRVSGQSPTWRELYERAKRGEAIPVPYHDVKVTDPDKLAAMTEAYLAYRGGALDPADLPDIRDVFPDDPWRKAELGFATEPGLDGEGVLVQACAQCHNDRLDQDLSRAAFNVDVDKLSRAEKVVAIERLRLPGTDVRAMPPRRVRTLTEEARSRLIDLLQR